MHFAENPNSVSQTSVDDEQTRIRRLLRFFIWGATFSSVTRLTVAWFHGWPGPVLLEQSILPLTTLLVGHIVLRKCSARAAAHFLISLLWVSVNYILFRTGGAERPVFIWNISLLMIAAFALGVRVSLIYAALTLAVGAGLTALRQTTLLPPPTLPAGPWVMPLGNIMSVAWSALVVAWAAQWLHRSLADLRKSRAELAAQNRLLREEIAARTAAQDGLRQASDRFQTFVSNASAIFFALDRNGIITFAEGRPLVHPRMQPGQAVGKSAFALYADLPDVVAAFRRAVAGEAFSTSLWVKDVCYESSYTPLHDPVTGQCIGTTGVAMDVTRRQLAEEAAHQARQAAETANHAKDRFLATVSHELRTPLTPVLLSVSSLALSPNLSPELRDELAEIQHHVEIEARLIDDLLDLTRIASGKLSLRLTPCNLHAAIDVALRVCREDLDARQLSVQTDLGAGTEFVDGDQGRLEQVFWNLLKNAIKFTPPGGAITIRTRTEDQDGSAAIIAEVTDSGIGIDSEAIGRIFGIFQQGGQDATRLGGLGVGLSICEAVVHAHYGTITAHSPGPGKGSTFTVRFPISGRHLDSEPDVPARTPVQRSEFVTVA